MNQNYIFGSSNIKYYLNNDVSLDDLKRVNQILNIYLSYFSKTYSSSSQINQIWCK